jgi:hypothetical protein
MREAVETRHKWLALLLSDSNLRACAVFTLVMALMPPEGLGIELCASQRLLNAPCPACGVTRCGSNLARGHFVRAMQLHPLGPVVVPVIAGLGVIALLPRRWREGLRAALMRRAVLLRPLYLVGLWSFVIYGVARWGAVFLHLAHFPAAWP